MKRFIPLDARRAFATPSFPYRHAVQPNTGEYVREWGTDNILLFILSRWGSASGSSYSIVDFSDTPTGSQGFMDFSLGLAQANQVVSHVGGAYGGIPSRSGAAFIGRVAPMTSSSSPISSIGSPVGELVIGGVFDFSMLPSGSGNMGIFSVGLGDETITTTLYYDVAGAVFVLSCYQASVGTFSVTVSPTQLPQWRWCIVTGLASDSYGMEIRVTYPNGFYDVSSAITALPSGVFAQSVEDATSVARLCPTANLTGFVSSSFVASNVFFAVGGDGMAMYDLMNLISYWGGTGLVRDAQ